MKVAVEVLDHQAPKFKEIAVEDGNEMVPAKSVWNFVDDLIDVIAKTDDNEVIDKTDTLNIMKAMIRFFSNRILR